MIMNYTTNLKLETRNPKLELDTLENWVSESTSRKGHFVMHSE